MDIDTDHARQLAQELHQHSSEPPPPPPADWPIGPGITQFAQAAEQAIYRTHDRLAALLRITRRLAEESLVNVEHIEETDAGTARILGVH